MDRHTTGTRTEKIVSQIESVAVRKSRLRNPDRELRDSTVELIGFSWMFHYSDYLREQAAKYRELAEKAEDIFVKQELIELADVCEEVANNIDDRRASG
jgi:hypothetical protein